MTEMVVIMLVSFAILLGRNVPIAVAIAGATFLCVVASGGDAGLIVANKMANGVDSFALLAIPFFVLPGILMGLAIMAVCFVFSMKGDLGKGERLKVVGETPGERMRCVAGLVWAGFSQAGLSLLLVVIVIGGILIGLCTPPVGSCLFIGCSVGKTSIARIAPTLIPFFVAMIGALMVITYWPAISLLVPGWFGLPK